MTAIARLGAISIDAPDPAALADFYQQLLALEVMWSSPDFIALKGAGVFLTFQRVADHQAATWPSPSVPKQLHLELGVDDLEAAQAAALSLGATTGEVQSSPDTWRVMIDPAGHPFCLTTLIPAE